MISSLLKKNKATGRRQTVYRALMLLCLIPILSVFSISAKGLKEYRESINHVRKDFSKIINGEMPADRSADFSNKVLENATGLLSPYEEVEIQGTTINIDNDWLADRVREYKQQPANSLERKVVLIEIVERLEAIELKLDELESSGAATEKDANKRKIGEVLSREEYRKPKTEESAFGKLIRRILEWFGSTLPQPTVSNRPSSGFPLILFALQNVIYAMVLGVIAFVVYKFAPFFIKKFRQREKGEKTGRIVLGEKFSADESSKSLFSEAERLALDGNLKAAIRKGYIALLFELSERKIIGLAKHKTNRDYLSDVRKRRELFEDVNGLTLSYERHWYGFASANDNDWEEFKSGYNSALNSKSERTSLGIMDDNL